MASLEDSRVKIESLLAEIESAADSLHRSGAENVNTREALAGEVTILKAECQQLKAERDAARGGEAEAKALLANASTTLAKSIERLGAVLDG